nr:hypothetical protein [Tanacetum cinerariifolium]
MTKVIKGEFENLGFFEISDDSFTCNTQLDTLCDEFNRLSRIDNDLFTYDIEESSDPTDENPIDENEVAEIFRIETNIFDLETPTYLRLMKIIKMTVYINGMKMCHGYMKNHGWIVEYGKNQSPLNINVNHSRSNAGHSEWPTCNWKDVGYCNGGNLSGAYIVGNMLRYQDLEWYEALKDGKLKDEALLNKSIMEGTINEEKEPLDET